jgi:UDP:flavonoid glycosyltransferase YjiC (YdhE family)
LTKYTRLVKNFLRILVCPLDWGIGHATRCVPIIKHLRKQNHKVIIAADGRPLEFLSGYFPDLECVRLPGFRVSYPSGNKMLWKMMLQSPAIFYNVFKEHRDLKRVIRAYHADVVISDNRFGLWSKDVYSVYLTHQVMIKAPDNVKWMEPFLHRIHKWFIDQYNECWIPDLPGERNLSGDLGHQYGLPRHGTYIGLLSRFEEAAGKTETTEMGKVTDLLVMLSGPEPQRSILENILLKELSDHGQMNVVILQGLPGKPRKSCPLPGVTVFNHLPDNEIRGLIKKAGIIICRPGYSTLMDLAVLGRGAVLVPTPGQTEHEYLAAYLSARGACHRVNQESFTLAEALESGRKLPANIDFETGGTLLEERIGKLFNCSSD